jgi:hypothetical protein
MLQPFGKAPCFSDTASLSIHDVTPQTTVIFGSHWCNNLKSHTFKTWKFSLCTPWKCSEGWMYSSTDSDLRNQLVWMVSLMPQCYKHVWESVPFLLKKRLGELQSRLRLFGTEKNCWPAANRTTIPRTSSPYRRHYIDHALPAPRTTCIYVANNELLVWSCPLIIALPSLVPAIYHIGSLFVTFCSYWYSSFRKVTVRYVPLNVLD